ncbi:hypothetical protein TX24_12575 [Pseudomonas lactis]|nr:hypothetical protein TX24_12575 [Pseudomonas lactis]OWQ39408.1 hypothetical protein CDH05_22100 [Pseudomonas lactis]
MIVPRFHKARRQPAVGASLLAKIVNDDTGNLDDRRAWNFFASKLAPTVGYGLGRFPQLFQVVARNFAD